MSSKSCTTLDVPASDVFIIAVGQWQWNVGGKALDGSIRALQALFCCTILGRQPHCQ
jgi:hypothetical protein